MIHFLDHKLTIVTSPKVMSTSLKLFAAEFEQSQRGSTKSARLEPVHRAFPTLPFADEQIPRGFNMVAVLRDPIDRFISGYQNKFQGQARDRLGAHLKRAGLNPRPSINELALNLREYVDRNTFVAHHFLPQTTYLGANAGLYEHLFTVHESHLLQSFLSERLGVEARILRSQQSRLDIPTPILSDEVRQALATFFADDYENFSAKLCNYKPPSEETVGSNPSNGNHRKRLVLHIGMPKTGSTAIQAGIARNKMALSRHGIAASAALGGPNNVFFSSLFSGRVPNSLKNRGLSTRKEWDQTIHDNSLWQRLNNEIASMASDQHTYLVSSEHLAGLEEDHISALMSWAGQRFEATDIVCYARDQVTAIPSSWQMRVRSGSRESLRYFTAKELRSGRFNRLAFAQRWAVAAPQSNLWFYEFPGDRGGDVTRHFFADVLGLDGYEVQHETQRTNESLSFAVTQAWRAINTLFPVKRVGPNRQSRINRRLRKFASRALRSTTKKPTFSEKDALKIRNFFAESNRLFAEQYLQPPMPKIPIGESF